MNFDFEISRVDYILAHSNLCINTITIMAVIQITFLFVLFSKYHNISSHACNAETSN